MGRRYSKEVIDFVRDHVEGRTAEDLAKLTNEVYGTQFTASSMSSFKKNHKLHSNYHPGPPPHSRCRIYTSEIKDFILANYKGVGYAGMADMVNQKYGTAYTKEQIRAFYHNHHLNSGLSGRFEPGHEYDPSCMANWKPSAEFINHQFSKGHLPKNTKPISYESIRCDGYHWVKIKMNKGKVHLNDNYVLKHHLIWEKAHGPLPEGYVVIFKDGDKENFDLDNLEAIPRQEHVVMNRKRRRSNDPEVTEAGLLLTRIEKAIKNRKEKGNGKA